MNEEVVLQEWEKDSHLNPLKLVDESLRIPKLHHKYLTLLAKARKISRDIEGELSILQKEKYILYSQGPSPEDKKKGKWDGSSSFPSKGAAQKSRELNYYIEGDTDYIAKVKQLGEAKELITILEEILSSIKTRSFIIRNALEAHKFNLGE